MNGAGVRLPRLLVLSDRRRCVRRGRTLEQTVAEALAAGARGVVLREKDLAPAERRDLADRLQELVAGVGGILLVASDAVLARACGAAGLHLAASDPWPSAPHRRRAVVGLSCHDLGEIAAARGGGADYATASPVFASPSKPGYGPPLGADGLARLVGAAGEMPVFALGGIDAGRVAVCAGVGAYGVAVMGAVMGAPEPGRAVAAVLEALGAAAPPRAGRR